MSSSFVIQLSNLDSYLSISPEYYREKFNTESVTEGIKISDIVYVLNGVTNKKLVVESILLDTSHTNNGIISHDGEKVISTELNTPKKIAKEGNVIISRLRPYLKQVGYVDAELLRRSGVEKVLLSTEYYILTPKSDEYSIAFLVPFLLSKGVQDVLNKAVEGGHHPRFKEEVLKDVVVPSEVMENHSEISSKVEKYIKTYRRFEMLRLDAFNV